MECLRWRGPTGWVYLDSADLNFSNRPVRTRMPGGVAGAQFIRTAPYADGPGLHPATGYRPQAGSYGTGEYL